jgi:branched-chain amino acid aminotransferase
MCVYLNGSFVSEAEARISVFDHGFLYGDGVFEGIRAYNGRIFCIDEHIERLYESAESIMIKIPLSRKEMKDAIIETVRRNDLKDAYIRPVVSRGKGALGLDPRVCAEPTIVIIVDAETRHPEDMRKAPISQQGIKVITTAWRRNGPDILSPRIKSTNYLNNILGKLQANAVGAHDAIFLNEQGYACELTGDNLFIIKNARVITPPLWLGVLDGITRREVLRVAAEQGFETAEEPLTLHDLYTGDECFCTATRIEVLPIVWIDGRQIGDGMPGPITIKLMQAYIELAKREGTSIYA